MKILSYASSFGDRSLIYTAKQLRYLFPLNFSKEAELTDLFKP